MRLLLVEDETDIQNFLKSSLKEAGYQVDAASDGKGAEKFAVEGKYDILVVDLGLPDQDGISLILRLRQMGVSAPVLILSARRSVDDRVRGLEHGGDDYLTKPFALDVLLAKVRASERRVPQTPAVTLRVADLELRIVNFELQRGERIVPLTRTECALLETLMRRSPNVVPHETLIERAWGVDGDVSYDSLYVFIRALRSKITHGLEPELLHTIRGVGYCLRAEN